MEWLYRYETKGIQAYILATEKVREMIGASALVERLGEEAKNRAGGRLVMAAAGSATIEFPDDDALRAFAASWPMWVARHAPGLHVVQAWAPLEGRAHHDALTDVLELLDAQRNVRAPELPEAGPLTARAARTGRAAVRRGKRDGLQDAATRAKDAETRAQDDESATANDVLREKLGLAEVPLAEDLDWFGEGYLAVLHADGNGVGKRIVEGISRRPVGDQHAFSEALTGATQAAARAAVRHLLERLDAKWASRARPFRPLVLGGDDFTAILRAEDALDFTRDYLAAFERATGGASQALGGALTACAGVAFVKSGFPLHDAHDLAESLCQAAKHGLRRGADTLSGLCFLRVTSAMAESLEALRSGELAVASRTEREPVPGGLMGGPWSLAQLEELRHLALATRRMPRGALREWLRLVQIDRDRADAHWRRVFEVLGDRGDTRAEIERALRAVGVRPDNGFRVDAADSTPLLDATTWAGLAGNNLSPGGPL